MPKSATTSSQASPTLYQEFLAEREEILRHKWLKSEQAQEDIGFESALVDWMLHHRTEWKKERAARRRNR